MQVIRTQSFSNGGTLGSSEQGPPRPEPEDCDLNLKPARNFIETPAISQESPHEDLASNKDRHVEVTAELQRNPSAAVDSTLMPPPKKPPSTSKSDFHLMPPPSLPGSLANREFPVWPPRQLLLLPLKEHVLLQSQEKDRQLVCPLLDPAHPCSVDDAEREPVSVCD